MDSAFAAMSVGMKGRRTYPTQNNTDETKLSKLKLDLELNHAWRGVAAKAGSKDGRWRALQVGDLTKLWVGNIVMRQTKVGVIEEIEKLKPDSELRFFPTRQLCVLHHGEVRVEISLPTKAISPLCHLNCITANASTR
jgi:hypothetical protein